MWENFRHYVGSWPPYATAIPCLAIILICGIAAFVIRVRRGRDVTRLFIYGLFTVIFSFIGIAITDGGKVAAMIATLLAIGSIIVLLVEIREGQQSKTPRVHR